MRIAYILLDLDQGGMVSWVYSLASRFHKDHEIHFLCSHVERIAPKFHDLGKAVFFDGDWSRMVEYLRKNCIDVVQFGQRREFADCALAAGVPVVIERLDGPGRVPVMPKTSLDAVVASTRASLEDPAQTSAWGKMHQIYNGVDIGRFHDAVPERFWFPDDYIVIGHLSRLSPGKNIGVLIDAFRILRFRHPNLGLVIVGANSKMPGASDHEVELRAQASDLGDSVIFTGLVDEPQDLIAGFDIFVMPSKSEGVPNALLETMAAGKPVVATNVGSIPELVRDGVDGFLVEKDNLEQTVETIEKLLFDEALRRKMGESAAKRIKEDFNLINQSQDYLNLYHHLVSRSSAFRFVRRPLRVVYGYTRLGGYAIKPMMQNVYSVFRAIVRRLTLRRN